MDKFNNCVTRGLSYLLIYLTAIQPLHPAFASLTPDNPRTQVKNAGSAPVVNIATPNAVGVSHNTYKDFSVGTPGAVLNNSTVAGKSQLAGQLGANANLKGKAADLIINEVTGTARSNLQGKVEVFGRRANVLIANPNGITCDGCGFINTPAVTLTTGKPLLDKQGALDALEIKKGGITIGGKGLDGTTTDYIDIISRATELNGKINAKNLMLTQGVNRVNFKSGAITPINGEGAKPKLAVDTKALGGMYAERIRLVATEDGVGVNLANLTSTQRGITLSAKGEIQLDHTNAKTDLSLVAQYTNIKADSTIKSGRDITITNYRDPDRLLMLLQRGASSNASSNLKKQAQLSSVNATTAFPKINTKIITRAKTPAEPPIPILYNQGNIIAGRNIQIFGSDLTNFRGSIEARDNLWIQGNAEGQRASHVRNESGIIKTSNGDLIIRADILENFSSNNILKTKDVGDNSGQIKSKNNIYLNVKNLKNIGGEINASKNIMITGDVFNQSASYVPTQHSSAENYDSINKTISGMVKAGNSLVIGVNDKITLGESYSYDKQSTSDVIVNETRPDTLSARNIVLNAKNIRSNDKINAYGDITLIASEDIHLSQSALNAANAISLLAAGNIDAWQSYLSAKDITLTARTGAIKFQTSEAPQFFHKDGSRQLGTLSASNDLIVMAGSDIYLPNIVLNQSRNITLSAGKNLTIENNAALLLYKRTGQVITPQQKQARFNQQLAATGRLNATGSMTLNAGGILSLKGVSITAGKDITLNSTQGIDLTPRELPAALSSLLPPSRTPELSSKLNAGNNLSIFSGTDITAKSAQISAKGNMTLLAGRHILLPAQAYSAIDNKSGNNKDDRNLIAKIQAGKNLTLASNGELIAHGTEFSSGGDMTLSSGGKMEFNAVANRIYSEGYREYKDSVTRQNAVLNSGGVLTLLSNGSILFQASKLIAKGALDAAAKGGFLYAQAIEESSHYQKITKKRKWYGKKTTIRYTRHIVTNKVTEFTAGGDISLLSRDDSTYQASKINAGKNARLTSTKGKVKFEAVKNTAFEQRITTSKGFFIKNADKGYTKDTWLLPKIYTGGKLTIDAARGITANVKTQNARSLQNTLLALGNTPGTAWVKGLNTRKDVQWNAVQDAYSSWNHKSQSLNPVVGAVIAIAIAAVTAGTGLAAAAGNLAAGAVGTGASATTVAATYGAAYAGMTALTSQAAVALVDNKGNLTKTLQAMSSSDSVKSLVTSMVIGGALSGLDSVMGWDKGANGTTLDPAKSKLPMLSNKDWSKVAQRVAGQSVINSSFGTAINGGSFKDNFTDALLANVGGQINAEGANLIGNNGQVLGVPGKILSHAVVAGVAAEISGDNVKGAAAGAMAAELAGIIINDNLVKTEGWQEQQAQVSRVAGAFAGALATGKASGVNSGANAAEIVERFNRQLHLDELQAIKELAKGDKAKEERLLAASCRQVNCTSQESLNSTERQQYEALMKKYPATREEDGLLANYWVQKERQRTGNYPLYAGYDMQQLFTYTTGDGVADSKQFSRNQFIEELSQYSGFSKDSLQKTFTILSSIGLVLEATKGSRYITFDGKYYMADNLKFSKSYYEKLWGIGGRPAPFLQAEEILKSKPTVTPDPNKKVGFLKYEGAGLEMIYNPTTKEVWHIQPIRKIK